MPLARALSWRVAGPDARRVGAWTCLFRSWPASASASASYPRCEGGGDSTGAGVALKKRMGGMRKRIEWLLARMGHACSLHRVQGLWAHVSPIPFVFVPPSPFSPGMAWLAVARPGWRASTNAGAGLLLTGFVYRQTPSMPFIRGRHDDGSVSRPWANSARPDGRAAN